MFYPRLFTRLPWRHILVDTLGLLLSAAIHPADVQDRDGGLPVLQEARRLVPFIKRIFAGSRYQGPATAAAVRAFGRWELEIVKRSDGVTVFKVLPKRWSVLPCTTLPGWAVAMAVRTS